MRVPGIARWPGVIEPGSVQMNLSSTLDLFVTALKLAGATPNEDSVIDGQDITPLLVGEETANATRPPFFYYGPNALHAVRKGPWKLHIKTSSQTGREYFGGATPLLFNLEEDPSEQYNLAEQYPEVVKELMQLIEAHSREVETTGSFYE